jgi:predicted nucleic acid-binding protein
MYLDTTLLAKLYVKEGDSGQTRRFVAGAYQRPVCSVLGKMEILATFHRKLREHEIVRAELNAIQMQFEFDVMEDRIEWLPLTNGVIEKVQNVFVTMPPDIFLRTGDAIHLATASEAGFKEIYSNDRHLLAAAVLFKLKGINPLAKKI